MVSFTLRIYHVLRYYTRTYLILKKKNFVLLHNKLRRP